MITYAKCLARYICAGPGKLLIVVLDNCDKRTRGRAANYVSGGTLGTDRVSSTCDPSHTRRHLRETQATEPPLDTALKGLIFRIEPPSFVDVLPKPGSDLHYRKCMPRLRTSSTLSYILPNGIKVSYPTSDQAMYLASILRSLYTHDKFVRRLMTGLAGRDMRRALELFLGLLY